MNRYRAQALQDALTFHAAFVLNGYENEEDLEEDIRNGTYDPNIYQDIADKETKVVGTLRLERGEAEVLFCENATWIVWFQDILNRWYGENMEYFDEEVNSLIA